MSEDTFGEGIKLVPSGNSCDICGKSAVFYSTIWYIHICSQECYDFFVDKWNKNVDDVTFTQLKPDEGGET